jgi:RND superfamily putative drug exporter
VFDATVIRALLVPALMRLLGNANWWMPRAAARALFIRDPKVETGPPAVDPV